MHAGRGGIKCLSCLGQVCWIQLVFTEHRVQGPSLCCSCDVRLAGAPHPTFPRGRLHSLPDRAPQALLPSLST